MKFGIICSNAYTEPAAWEHAYPPPRSAFDARVGQRMLEDTIEQAVLADELGYDHVSVTEHHSIPLACSPNAAVLAGALSRVVKRATIAFFGPLVSVNNPVRLAEEIAMLDQLTDGRLIVLPLRGTPQEHVIYNNIDPAQTRAITEDGTLLIRKALTETEPFSWKSEHFDFPVVSVWPGRTQVPHPPIFYSGNSTESALFAARNRFPIAISFHGTEQVAELTALYREAAAQAGWMPGPDDIAYRGYIALGATSAEAEEIARTFLPGKAKEGGIKSALGSVQFRGDVDQVTEQIREFQDRTGVGRLDVSFGRSYQAVAMAAIRSFGENVLPGFRS